MTREKLIEFAKYLDEGCNLLGEGYIESRTDEYLQKVANKNFVLADVSQQRELLIDFIKWLRKDYEVEDVYEMYADEYLQEKSINCC